MAVCAEAWPGRTAPADWDSKPRTVLGGRSLALAAAESDQGLELALGVVERHRDAEAPWVVTIRAIFYEFIAAVFETVSARPDRGFVPLHMQMWPPVYTLTYLTRQCVTELLRTGESSIDYPLSHGSLRDSVVRMCEASKTVLFPFSHCGTESHAVDVHLIKRVVDSLQDLILLESLSTHSPGSESC